MRHKFLQGSLKKDSHRPWRDSKKGAKNEIRKTSPFLVDPFLPGRRPWGQDLATWKAQSEQGDFRAQYNLGLAYYDGSAGVTKDFSEAARYFKLSADQGFAPSAANLGLMYFKGEGLPPDHAEALRYFRIGAEGGDATARLRWFLKAASQGFVDAYFQLGVLFNEAASKIDQQYRDETLVKAYMFFALAAARDPRAEGSAQAEAAKAKVAAKMSPELVAEALRQVESYGN